MSNQQYASSYLFHTYHDQYRRHHGKRVTIVRPLRDGDEIDLIEVGPMYRVRLDDGEEFDVFEDELVREAAEYREGRSND